MSPAGAGGVTLREAVNDAVPQAAPLIFDLHPRAGASPRAFAALADAVAAEVGEFSTSSTVGGISARSMPDIMAATQKMSNDFPDDPSGAAMSAAVAAMRRAVREPTHRRVLMADVLMWAGVGRLLAGEAAFRRRWARAFSLMLQGVLAADPLSSGAASADMAAGLTDHVSRWHDSILRAAAGCDRLSDHLSTRLSAGAVIAMDFAPDAPSSSAALAALRTALAKTENGRAALFVADASIARARAEAALRRAGLDPSNPRLDLRLASAPRPGDAWLRGGRITQGGATKALGRLDAVYAVNRAAWEITDPALLVLVLLGTLAYDAGKAISADLRERAFTLIQA
jgi:hypothetical protein